MEVEKNPLKSCQDCRSIKPFSGVCHYDGKRRRVKHWNRETERFYYASKCKNFIHYSIGKVTYCPHMGNASRCEICC